jgi:hypothetical protein
MPFYPTCRFGPQKADKISHSERLNYTQTSLAYVEQQREATATDVLLLRQWRDLAAEKRKQIHITNLFKK